MFILKCFLLQKFTIFFVLASEKYNLIVSGIIKDTWVEAGGERRRTQLHMRRFQIDNERFLRKRVIGTGKLAAYYKHLVASALIEYASAWPL